MNLGILETKKKKRNELSWMPVNGIHYGCGWLAMIV